MPPRSLLMAWIRSSRSLIRPSSCLATSTASSSARRLTPPSRSRSSRRPMQLALDLACLRHLLGFEPGGEMHLVGRALQRLGDALLAFGQPLACWLRAGRRAGHVPRARRTAAPARRAGPGRPGAPRSRPSAARRRRPSFPASASASVFISLRRRSASSCGSADSSTMAARVSSARAVSCSICSLARAAREVHWAISVSMARMRSVRALASRSSPSWRGAGLGIGGALAVHGVAQVVEFGLQRRRAPAARRPRRWPPRAGRAPPRGLPRCGAGLRRAHWSGPGARTPGAHAWSARGGRNRRRRRRRGGPRACRARCGRRSRWRRAPPRSGRGPPRRRPWPPPSRLRARPGGCARPGAWRRHSAHRRRR